jgi:hypothetical protein
MLQPSAGCVQLLGLLLQPSAAGPAAAAALQGAVVARLEATLQQQAAGAGGNILCITPNTAMRQQPAAVPEAACNVTTSHNTRASRTELQCEFQVRGDMLCLESKREILHAGDAAVCCDGCALCLQLTGLR